MAITQADTLENPRCKNCGSALGGDFCARCGQQARDVRRPFLLILQEFMYVLLELDGRAYRTLYYLFTRPGFLSLEYVQGRRASYTPPLRLFLVISIGFLLIVSVQNTIQSVLETIEESVTTAVSEAAPEPPGPAVDIEAPQQLDPDQITAQVDAAIAELEADLDEDFGSDGISLGLSFDDREELHDFIDTVEFGFLSADFNNNLRAVMHAQADENFDALNENPEEVLYNASEYVTVFMLIMMPILALIQQIMFVLSRRFYIEHLILTVHNHSFLFFAMFLVMVTGWIEQAEWPVISAAFGYLGGFILIWMFIYLYLSLKRFFGTGYISTFILFFFTSLIYLVVSSTGLFFFAATLFFLV